MNSRLLTSAAALAVLLTTWPAPAYIKAPPRTLGSVCLESDHVCVLKVEKVDAEKGVIHFKHVDQLKGKHGGGPVVKHLIKPDLGEMGERSKANAAKIILDAAAEGKTAVMFYFTGPNSRGHVYIDGYWYWVVGTDNPSNWVAAGGEPTQLTIYCGAADKIPDAIARILKGEEVVVSVMSGDNRADLMQRRGKVLDVRASLKIVDADTLRRLANRADGKKPGVKPVPGDTKPDPNAKPGDKKPEPGPKPEPGEKKSGGTPPALVGTVKAVAADGKSFTLLLPPTEKTKEPRPVEIGLTERTTITDGKAAVKLAVGQPASVWLEKSEAKVAAAVEIVKPSDKPQKPNEK